jgi:hypothetical protein
MGAKSIDKRHRNGGFQTQSFAKVFGSDVETIGPDLE